MFDLCNSLFVQKQDNLIEGSIFIESCAEFDSALTGYVVTCLESNLLQIEKWIDANVRRNAEHCKNTLKKEPIGIFKFIAKTNNIQSYTEEFVKMYGGVQSFLDQFATINVVDNSVDEIVEEPEIDDSADSNIAIDSIKKELKNESLTSEKSNECSENKCLEELNLETKKKEVQEVEIKQINASANDFCYESGLSLQRAIQMIKDAKLAIDLSGLDPQYVLEQEEIHQVVEYLDLFAPSVFKLFIMEYTKNATQSDLAKVSSLLDSFVSFSMENFGGVQ